MADLIWDKALFDKFYRVPGERWGLERIGSHTPLVLHYHWYSIGQAGRAEAAKWPELLNIPKGSRVLVIGAGFGWALEGLRDAGMITLGTDTSEFIQANKNTSEEAELIAICENSGVSFDTHKIRTGQGTSISPRELWLREGPRCQMAVIDEDAATPASRQVIRDAMGGNPDFIITEYVMYGLNDAAARELERNLEKLRAPIYHMIVDTRRNTDPRLNTKRHEDWAGVLNAPTFTEAQVQRLMR
jgi:hypothetical protein